MCYQVRKKLKILMLTRMDCDGFYLMSTYIPCLKIFCKYVTSYFFVIESGGILKFVLTGETEFV